MNIWLSEPCLHWHHVISGINSLWPSNSIDLVHIGSGNGLVLDGTKPLPEPMLIYHQRDSGALTWVQFRRKCSIHIISLKNTIEKSLLWLSGANELMSIYYPKELRPYIFNNNRKVKIFVTMVYFAQSVLIFSPQYYNNNNECIDINTRLMFTLKLFTDQQKYSDIYTWRILTEYHTKCHLGFEMKCTWMLQAYKSAQWQTQQQFNYRNNKLKQNYFLERI